MLTGLATGTAYYVGVTAVDAHGQESACTEIPDAVVAREDFSVTPNGSLSFGSVSVGNSAERTFRIANAGGTAVAGGAMASAPFRGVAGSPYSIPAGESAPITVRFSPTAAATATSNVTFTGPGGNAVSRVVTGLGTTTTTSDGQNNGNSSGQNNGQLSLSVRLTAPTNGAQVTGEAVALTAEASDN